MKIYIADQHQKRLFWGARVRGGLTPGPKDTNGSWTVLRGSGSLLTTGVEWVSPDGTVHDTQTFLRSACPSPTQVLKLSILVPLRLADKRLLL